MINKTSSTQRKESPDSRTVQEKWERLIALAPTDKSEGALQQDRSPRIVRPQSRSKTTFFSPGHNGRGSKD